MEYRVTSREGEWGGREIDAVFAVDEYGRCWMLADSDGDGSADSCRMGRDPACGERSRYSEARCTKRQLYWYEFAAKRFDLFYGSYDLSWSWRFLAARREAGVIAADFSCGPDCRVTLYDGNSDGLVEEAVYRINFFSVAFAGGMPDYAHRALQKAVFAALDRFIPGEFTAEMSQGFDSPVTFSFSDSLSFSVGAGRDAMTLGGTEIAFPAATSPIPEATIRISPDGGTTPFEFSPDDLGVVPMTGE
jgi:hypothetical protein